MCRETENITLNMHARETLVRARSWLIDEGWNKGSMHDNGWCLAGAITAVWDSDFGEDAMIRAQNVLAHVLCAIVQRCEIAEAPSKIGEIGQPLDPMCLANRDITVYNDLPTTTFADVLNLIDLGINRLDAKIAESCKCDYGLVVLEVDWGRLFDSVPSAVKGEFTTARGYATVFDG